MLVLMAKLLVYPSLLGIRGSVSGRRATATACRAAANDRPFSDAEESVVGQSGLPGGPETQPPSEPDGDCNAINRGPMAPSHARGYRSREKDKPDAINRPLQPSADAKFTGGAGGDPLDVSATHDKGRSPRETIIF